MPDTNSAPEPGPETPFEIGLVMAGAVSAGAYTAGVIDFLIEALDQWELAKEFAKAHPDDPKAKECPTHSVKIKVMAGASAGGMTAALAAGMLGMSFETVTRQNPPDRPSPPIEPSNNNLYQSWVNKVDIVPMLGLRDFETGGKAPVQSVLDSSVLLDIANASFTYDRPNDKVSRPYVADPLHVLLTVTNLRGVPYAPEFKNWPKTQQYEMMMHADNMHFILSKDQPRPEEGAFWLEPYRFKTEGWGALQTAALATGAFPVGLAPRLLSRLASHYSVRQWAMPGPHEENGQHYCEYWKTVPPFWHSNGTSQGAGPGAGSDFNYEFLCVDGGVMNNEPLDLVRRILTGPDGVLKGEGKKATRAVIMILPFPNTSTNVRSYNPATDLFRLLLTTFNSLINQARFKPAELTMANDPNVYSRFLIVPRRGYRPDGTLEPNTIACGSLGGFGGFLARKFREHDYQLGRRNCQWFLKQYFALPSQGPNRNALFDHWTPEALKKHKVVKSNLAQAKGPEGDGDGDGDGPDEVLLPIIPLTGKAEPFVDLPTWPQLTGAELAALRPRIKQRLNRVVNSLVGQTGEGAVLGPLARSALKWAWWFQSDNAVDRVTGIIRKDLSDRGLMGP